MFDQLRAHLREFSDAPPGTRFCDRQQRHRGTPRVQRALAFGAGGLLLVAGVLMLVFPGPGLLVLVLGLALVSGESRRASQVLDRLDVAGHRASNAVRRRWRRLPRHMRAPIGALLFVLVIAFTATCTWLAWRYGGALL